MKIRWDTPVRQLPGVGEVKASRYEKMGIATFLDLVRHVPTRYQNRGDVRSIIDGNDGLPHAFVLTVATLPKITRLRSHKSFLKFRAFDESASAEIVYFNQDYLKNSFPVGAEFRFYGKIKAVGLGYGMSAPIAEMVTGSPLKTVYPVYAKTDGLSQKQIAKDIETVLSLAEVPFDDALPKELLDAHTLTDLKTAVTSLHYPMDEDALKSARRRLLYEQFFAYGVGLSLQRSANLRHTAPPCPVFDPSVITNRLPYELTAGQRRALDEISADMKNTVPMSRLLVGDVGCGKTAVAALATLQALQNGRQAMLMAPTEILAEQHFSSLAPLFTAVGYKVALLTGSTKAKEKDLIKTGLRDGHIHFVIGTHALLTDNVELHTPGLIITDEQHRFGSAQKARLSEKNAYAHMLIMSATPIPRSLALTLYGDLDISVIDEMPKNRQTVDTFAVNESYRGRIDAFIGKQLEEGGQVYVVCPAIEETEDEENEDEDDVPRERNEISTATGTAERLKGLFPDADVRLLHGKMKGEQKDKIMRAFAQGTCKILVSTTVIEVGVNVPNATLMVVENAERFGLAQLHQLRGRVGRGDKKSYCILFNGTSADSNAGERLKTLCDCHDGLSIAKKDLELRGPGDFLRGASGDGIRQSGCVRFPLSPDETETEIFVTAAEDARRFIDEHPRLDGFDGLKKQVDTLFTVEDGFIN